MTTLKISSGNGFYNVVSNIPWKEIAKRISEMLPGQNLCLNYHNDRLITSYDVPCAHNTCLAHFWRGDACPVVHCEPIEERELTWTS